MFWPPKGILPRSGGRVAQRFMAPLRCPRSDLEFLNPQRCSRRSVESVQNCSRGFGAGAMSKLSRQMTSLEVANYARRSYAATRGNERANPWFSYREPIYDSNHSSSASVCRCRRGDDNRASERAISKSGLHRARVLGSRTRASDRTSAVSWPADFSSRSGARRQYRAGSDGNHHPARFRSGLAIAFEEIAVAWRHKGFGRTATKLRLPRRLLPRPQAIRQSRRAGLARSRPDADALRQLPEGVTNAPGLVVDVPSS
jgi:hypothetical protein